MTALTAVKSRSKPLVGSKTARIAPPRPARTAIDEMLDVAKTIGLELYPWQVTAARYLAARGPSLWLYREVATIVARQNGKTSDLELLVLTRMVKRAARVIHAAQNRELPRESHARIADLIDAHYSALLPKSGIRFGSGQESIKLKNGAHYRIVAPTRSGARGPSNDLVVIDELLEMEDFDFIAAAKPTTVARPDPQIAYFSNAGTPESVVLNALRARADADRNLAYLEWSAGPERKPDDVRGWAEANPSIGHNPTMLAALENEYQANFLGGSMDVWEREHLCRWASSNGQPPLLLADEWERQDFTLSSEPIRATFGIKVDPTGSRASAVCAWPLADGHVALDVVADVTGNPIGDWPRLGRDFAALANRLKARTVAFDPYTDADLVRYFRVSKPINGRDYIAASEKFVSLALARQLAVRDASGILARDLESTVRAGNSNGTYLAVKSSPEATNTAIEAAIRAAWFASAPQPRVMVY